MPKAAMHALIWSSEQNLYAIYEKGQRYLLCLPENDGAWLAWLAERSSFSFQGRHGHLNLLKETRARGNEGYWYAYRRQGQRRIKQYAGRTSDVTIARLEELAHDFAPQARALVPVEKHAQPTPADFGVPQFVRREQTIDEALPLLRRGYAARQVQLERVVYETDLERRPARQGPLLVSRLCPPPLPVGLIPRARLLALLDAGLERKLTLLSAPAGSGKTTLLTQWLAAREQQVAWLSLDREHNDPHCFLAYLVGSLRRVYPDLGRSILASLQIEGQMELSECFILLLNELAAQPGEITLILDNYHLIESQEIQNALKLLLTHLPAHVHMIIASRSEPSGLLARLCASGQLMELGVSALRLTREEMEKLLTSVFLLRPVPEELDILAERTDGWLAGLYLAQSSMQDQMNVAHFLAACAGDNRHIQTYFLEEVLESLPPAIQTFILHTAPLERCNSALCAAVTGQEDTALMLEELAQLHIFISPLAEQEGWYRYHPLFASALHHYLRRAQPELVATLHRRASRWFEAHALLAEAVDHALAAHEQAHAATLIESIAPGLVSEGKITVLQDWLDALPEAIVRASPRLCICRVWQEFITAQPDRFILWVEAAEEALHRLEKTLPPPTLMALRSEIIALRSVYTVSFADFSEVITACRQALQQLPAESHYLRGLILMLLGLAYTRGVDVDAAARALSEANSNIQAAGHALLIPYVSMAQAELYATQGYPFQAAKLYRQIFILATEQNLSSRFAAGLAHAALGSLLWEWNNLAEARHHLLQAWALGQRTQTISTLFHSGLYLALVAQAQGDSATTQSWIHQLELLGQDASFVEFADTLAAIRAKLALAEGRLDEALFWMRTQNQRTAEPNRKRDEFVDFTLTRILLAAGHGGIEPAAGARASELLEYWRVSADQAGRTRVLLEALILQSLALQLQGDHTAALHSLQRAVTLAEPGRYIRLFVAEGDPLARLLRHLLEQQRTRKVNGEPLNLAYLSTLLKAFTQPGTFLLPTSPIEAQPLFDPLSLREREVLRLMAAGRKNREIADELVVVTGTVKAHINMIYQKLGVTNRVQAITRARSLGIL